MEQDCAGRPMNKIPILLYHDLCSDTDTTKDDFAVTRDDFRKQMDHLYQNGYIGVSLEKMFAEIDYWRGEEGKGEGRGTKGETADMRKKVVLTFDDGNLSDHHYVLPVLKEKGFTATFFITVNEIGKPGRMDWQMVYDLARNGMGIGSHGLNHSFLVAHNNYTVLNELLMSKQILEKYIRKRVDFLSVPKGFYNKRVLTIARDVGFKAACVSDAGFSDLAPADGAFLLKRFVVRKNWGLRAFKSVVGGTPSVFVRVPECLRTVLRKTLGWQVYDRMKRFRNRINRKSEVT